MKRSPLASFSLTLRCGTNGGAARRILELPRVVTQSGNYRVMIYVSRFRRVNSFPSSLAFRGGLHDM